MLTSFAVTGCALLPHALRICQHLGYLHIGQCPHETGHRLARWPCERRRAIAAFDKQPDQRRRIFRQHRRIASQRRKGVGNAHTVVAMASRTKTAIHIKAERQLIGHAVAIDGRTRRIGGRRVGAGRLLRGQRLQIARDCLRIVVGEVLRAVFDLLDHTAIGDHAAGVPRLQKRCDAGGAQSAKARSFIACEVRREPVIIDAACEIALRRFVVAALLERRAARRMTGAAMTERLHQIRTAIPLRIMVRTQPVHAARRECKLPEAQRPTLIERKRHVRRRRRICDGHNAMHDVVVERPHVVVRYFGKRRIWHRRIQSLTVPRYTLAQGARKILVGVLADAEVPVRRDVARHDRAEWRCKAQSACERRTTLRRRMAACAIARLRDVFTAREHCVIRQRRLRRRGDGSFIGCRRNEQKRERAAARQCARDEPAEGRYAARLHRVPSRGTITACRVASTGTLRRVSQRAAIASPPTRYAVAAGTHMMSPPNC